METSENIKAWLNSPILTSDEKQSIRDMSITESENAFGTDLQFGTAGLRGIMGLGTNRMNKYTVRHATQALADVIKAENIDKPSVAIAFDSRNHSEEFARCSAEVLIANGISVYIFDDIRPTPELSYAVRVLKCTAGINITASHNPKEYNGYKVYWNDGAQITPAKAERIHSIMCSKDIFGVKFVSLDDRHDYVTILDKDFDESYLNEILKQQTNPALCKRQSAMPIVYTPFHGTGRKLVPEVLKRAGFANIITVTEQMTADGNFPTVKSPNPENPEGFAMAVKTAEINHADIIIGTDPDADRIGVMVKNKEKKFEVLTGNQTGAILIEYLISAKRKAGVLPQNGAIVKTVVTSELGAKIAEANGLTVFNVLTGFKYIGEKIEQFNSSKRYSYIFGYEESYGSLIGEHARDKDAVVASLVIAEAAAYYKEQGKTLYDVLLDIFAKYGVHKETNLNIYVSGTDPLKVLSDKMSAIRKNGITEINGLKVIKTVDYIIGIDGLPKSDMLWYKLEDGTIFIIRPSGTEPKMKVYILATGKTIEETDEKLKVFAVDFQNLLDKIG